MNVLYISYDGLTDPLGQSQVLPYLIGLSSCGHMITVLSCEKKERYIKGKNKVLNLIKEKSISWVPISYTSKPPVLSTIYDIRKIKIQSKKIIGNQKFDIVHCRSYISSFVGLYLKRKYGLKFIFDMRGFYPDERVDGNLWNLKNPLYKAIYKFFKFKEREFLSNADYVISLTENGKQEIHSWAYIPNQPIPIEVIPCCVDLDLFSLQNIKTENLEEIKRDLLIKADDFILSYLGSIGTWYLLDEMLEFFKRLLMINNKAKFLFITADDRNSIIKKALEFGIAEESLIIVNASHEQVPVYAKLSDISIFFIKPVYSKKASSPTKQGELMSLGIPIICNSNVGDTDTIILESKAGYVVNDFTEIEFDKAIAHIADLVSIPKIEIMKSAEKYFALEKGVRSYNKVYKQLFN